MVASFGSAFALVSIAALATGCGEDAPNYSAAGKEKTCEQQCIVLHDCDKTVDTSACQGDCVRNEAISLQGQEVITSCIQEQECDGSNPIRLVDCIDDGLGELEPSPAGQTFCAETLDAYAACSETELKEADRSDCLDGVSALADEVVMHLTDCSASKDTCEAKQLCALLILREATPAESLGATGDALTTLLESLLKSATGSPL